LAELIINWNFATFGLESNSHPFDYIVYLFRREMSRKKPIKTGFSTRILRISLKKGTWKKFTAGCFFQ
jgi:hypothetical protein